MSLKFQFHKGAIRTSFIAAAVASFLMFQFHKGAIRTILVQVSIFMFLGFNSIKVRLEPDN